jgi:hypothetical protein
MNLLWKLCGYRTSSIFDETKDIDECKLYKMYGYSPLSYEKFSRWNTDQQLHFIKTHNACTGPAKAIYIVRDGRDVMCSLAHFNIAMKRTNYGFDDEMYRCITSRGFSWSRRVMWWVKKRASFAPTAIVKYEDLVNSPVSVLCEAFEKLKVPIDIQGTPQKFETLNNIEPRQFYKGKVEIWKEEMSELFQELFWSLHGDAMKELGYGWKPSKLPSYSMMQSVEPKQPVLPVSLLSALVSGLGAAALSMAGDTIYRLLDGMAETW